MKHSLFLIALSLSSFLSCAARAQSEWGEPTSGAESAVREMVYHYAIEERRDDLCDKFGCLIVINETPDMLMTGMYLDTAFVTNGGRNPVWSKNMLSSPGIYPMRATLFPTKFKQEEACAVLARFEFRNYATKERFSVRRRVSLCMRPGLPFVRLRIRATPGGKVILEDGTATDPKPGAAAAQ